MKTNLRVKGESGELLIFASATSLLALLFSIYLFGAIGARFWLGLIIIVLPFYLIFNNFNLTLGEKFVFSSLCGLSLFAALVYLLGLLISFRISIAVVFIALTMVSVLIKRRRDKVKDFFKETLPNFTKEDLIKEEL